MVFAALMHEQPKDLPTEARVDGGLAGITAAHRTWNDSVTSSERRGKCCHLGRGDKEAQPQACS